MNSTKLRVNYGHYVRRSAITNIHKPSVLLRTARLAVVSILLTACISGGRNQAVPLYPNSDPPPAREQLAHLLRTQLDPKTTYVVTTVFGLVIRRDPLTTRVPDLAVFIASRLVERDGYVESPPGLIVEVLSSGNTRMERAEKLKDYESLGVPEVWVLSPEAQSVEVLQLNAGRLLTTALLKDGPLTPLHFPGATIDIPSIWPR